MSQAANARSNISLATPWISSSRVIDGREGGTNAATTREWPALHPPAYSQKSDRLRKSTPIPSALAPAPPSLPPQQPVHIDRGRRSQTTSAADNRAEKRSRNPALPRAPGFPMRPDRQPVDRRNRRVVQRRIRTKIRQK